MTPLPPDWATLQQPAPRNHGRPAIDALRPGQPLREVVGDFLADAAISRAEVGERTYGSKLTANNGRDNLVDGLQEDADGTTYYTAGYHEAPESSRERYLIRRALSMRSEAAEFIQLAAIERAKRLAKGEVK